MRQIPVDSDTFDVEVSGGLSVLGQNVISAGPVYTELTDVERMAHLEGLNQPFVRDLVIGVDGAKIL